MRPIRSALFAALVAAAPALAQPAAEDQRVLEQLARDATAAQQLGHLAADKNIPVEVALLGDSVAATASELNLRLDEIARQRNIELPQISPEQMREEFADMAPLNGDAFVERFAAALNELYPRLVENAQALAEGGPPEMTELLPRLETQFVAGEQLSAKGAIDPQTAEALRQEGPIERKDDPAVLPQQNR